MSSELPSDIVFEMLIQLSVKHLLCLRCVSKSWRAITDSPLFINGHLKRSIETTTNHQLIVGEWDLGTIDRPSTNLHSASIDEGLCISLKGMSKPPIHQFGRLYSNSCNGLIFMHDAYEAVTMWNPFTKRCRKIPTEPFETPNKELRPDCPSKFGFGYDNVNDDYKAVRIMGFHPIDAWRAAEVKVYSLRTNTWRRVQDFPHPGYIFCQDYGAFASGASHWLLCRHPDDLADIDMDLIDDRDVYVLAAFDYVKEEFQVLPQPEYAEKVANWLVALQGCLCLLSITHEQDAAPHVTMYKMTHYGMRGSWNKSHIFTQAFIPSGFVLTSPLMYSMRGDKLLHNVFFYDASSKCRNCLVWYDLRERKGSKVAMNIVYSMHWFVWKALLSLVN